MVWCRGMLAVVLVGFVGWSSVWTEGAEPVVTGVTPREGSINGGLRITVEGMNFPDSFSLNDPNVGTRTTLISVPENGGAEYDCDLHIDGVTNVTTTCYTRPMPPGEYYVRVTADGEDVTEHCREDPKRCIYTVTERKTPTIDSLEPRSGTINTLLRAEGKLFTSHYGSNERGQSDAPQILKVWAGSGICNTKDLEQDTVYGLELTDGNYGYMMCIPDNDYIGNYNLSFLVDGIGRSLPDPKLMYVHTNGIGMVQLYTEIEELSASAGSKNGGLMLTISGAYFDDTDSPVRVEVGGEDCEVQEPFTSSEIVCKTPPVPAPLPAEFTGGRGLKATVVEGTTDFETADWSTGVTSRVDEARLVTNAAGAHVTKMEGVLLVPETGKFQFYLNVKGSGKLTLTPLDVNTELLSFTSSVWNSIGKASSTLELQKGQKLKMVVMTSSSSSESEVAVTARLYNAVYLASQTGASRSEVQIFDFTSDVEQEVQHLVVTSSGQVNGRSEVQTLTVAGELSEYFVVGFHGAFTGPLTAQQTDSEALSGALNALPSMFGDEVTVTDTLSDTQRVYTITFPAARGNVAQLEAEPATNASGASPTVATKTEGESTLESFQLEFGGTVTKPIPPNASPAEVRSALKDSAGVRCPAAFRRGVSLMDCESASDCAGERVGHEEPFCGRFSARNPDRVYTRPNNDDWKGYSIDSNGKYLCMAHKGKVTGVWLKFRHRMSSKEDYKVGSTSFPISVSDDVLDQWLYSCIDIQTKVRDVAKNKLDYRLEAVAVWRDTSSLRDVFIDDVVLVSQPTVQNTEMAARMRLRQARPNDAFIRGVEVTGSEGNYTVKIDPHLCGNGFQLFAVWGGQTTQGSIEASSNSATSVLSSGEQQLELQVSRSSRASIPIAGTFTVSFNGQTSTPILATPEPDLVVVSDKLSAISTLGDVDVTFNGDCTAFQYTVTMATKAGDQNEMTLDASDVTGNNVVAKVVTQTNGSLYYQPIPGDILRTLHDKPQVELTINNVPTACNRANQADSMDCSFEWTDALTPTVTDVSPDSGCDVASVTITGTGFADSGNVITIGGADCTETSASATSLTCSLSVGSEALSGDLSQNVKVVVPNKGLALGSVTFTFTPSISSFSPAQGSMQGGLDLTLTGQCFSDSTSVVIGGQTAVVKSRSSTQLVVIVPEMIVAPARRKRESHRYARQTTTQPVAVTVVQSGNQVTAGSSFTYSQSATPRITGIAPTQVSAAGGDVTITGIKFGTEEPNVVVLDTSLELEVTSHSDTEVVVKFPPIGQGSYTLGLSVPGVGLAEVNSGVPPVTVTFEVTGMNPVYGSMYGGTIMTVEGEGFGDDDSLLDVTLGGHACPVETVSDALITCKLAYTGTEYTVTNQGKHKDYGTGYAYDPKVLSILTGDCVTWRWTTPSHVTGITYGIFETEDDETHETLSGGFASPGTKKANGQYRFCFTKPGDYYYWSGYVNEPYNSIYLRGQVTVTRRTSTLADLKVTLAGVEAAYDTGASRRKRGAASDPDPCDPVTGLIAGCTPQEDPTPTSTDRFQHVLHECATPTITSISPRRGTGKDTVTFEGTGFGTEDCQNEITYAGVGEGVVTSSSATSLSFTLGTAGPPPVGVLEEFTLRVGNRGNVLVAIKKDAGRRFGFLPAFWEMTPAQGSKGGRTLVTFSGSGFAPSVGDIAIAVGGKACDVQTATETEVTCLTPPGDDFINVAVEVYTATGSGQMQAECRAPQCAFQYSSDLTPTVDNIAPDVISASPTTLTMTGTGFGATQVDVTVTVGGSQCSLTSVADDQVVCECEDVPAGTHAPEVRVDNKGLADTSNTVISEATISDFFPQEGSTNGGTVVTITGHGFEAPSLVTIDDEPCEVTSDLPGEIECVTSAHAAGLFDLVVTSAGVEYSAETFTFSAAATPSVVSTSPEKGEAGETVTINGDGFSTTPSENTVRIGDVEATVNSATATQLSVTLGNQMTGSYAVLVNVQDKGDSNDDVMFEYELGDFTFSPSSGTTAGGTAVTLTGSGFVPDMTEVTICDEICIPVEGETTASQLVCTTPASSSLDTTSQCNVKVTVNSLEKTASTQYTYDASITPEVTGVEPRRGGTAGGTPLTISGSGFGTSIPNVSVKIGGAVCDVSAVTDTEITCTTNSAPSGDYEVDVNVNEAGSAIQADAGYRYIDVWSSPFTWDGDADNIPGEGDLVDIPPGQILLLDTTTPRLRMLIIRGKLIFDEMDLELHADNILITDGGSLQVGTEDSPFPAQYTACIVLHGHLRSRELPIYGTKVIAVRNGTLDMHGSPTPVTWTLLASEANAGDTSITLTTPVNWRVGDEIVIPTTSHRHSWAQNEVRKIDAISGDGLTLTLDKPLDYKHVSEEHTLGSGDTLATVALRGEVGLLSHNVKLIGSENDEWLEDIEACDETFDTGEFKTQTCFQGKFGSETIGSQFGATILAHCAVMNCRVLFIRLSYVEIYHAGQAFRLGRYPVHFHMNGDMTGSYVRGVAIQKSSNRAVNVHGSQNILVEHTVIYNIMGGAFFLEDGIETGNTFQYNLAVFVRPSSSLVNDDITPAAFWLTHPSNIIFGNAVAGCTHFAYWYRMKEHPTGPSFDPAICPRHAELGKFENNTAHSLGWFALWIFEQYDPRVGGGCSSDTRAVAVFKDLTAWNCEKGAETVITGWLQFVGFILINNEKAGWEGKMLKGGVFQYDADNGPLVDGGMIVSHIGNKLDQEGSRTCTAAGLVLPFKYGLLVRGVAFYNFDSSSCAAFGFATMVGTCLEDCGGFTYYVTGLKMSQVTNKGRFDWKSQGVIRDLDGSLTTTVGGAVLATTGILPTGSCQSDVQEFSYGQPGSVCDATVKFHRFAWNNISPKSLEAKGAIFTNQYGSMTAPFKLKATTHKPGWHVVLVGGECYDFEFEDAPPIVNISYDAVFYQMEAGDSLCFRQTSEKPDHFKVDGSTPIPESDPFPSPADAENGDWFYDVSTGKINYYVMLPSAARKKRAAVGSPAESWDVNVRLRSYQCFFDACLPPPDVLAVLGVPPNRKSWADPASWTWRDGGKPQAGDSVTIPADMWFEIDETPIVLDELEVLGGLSVQKDLPEFTLDVSHMYILGRFAVGFEDDPYTGSGRILLRGQRSDPDYPVTGGAPLGSKFIAVFGVLDLHGADPGVKVSRLSTTASPGDTTLTLADSVTWSVGDEIMLTTTDLSPWHTETFRLTNVAGNVVTLNSSVQYRHIAHTETLSSDPDVQLSARVALLSRGIKVEGAAYDKMEEDSFGARVFVGKTAHDDELYSGSARISNTEFYHTGQEGWSEPYDARYSVTFQDIVNFYNPSDPSHYMYSYVTDSTFHNGYSPAIGVFAVDDFKVIGNVIHHVVGKGIETNSARTHLEANLVALTIWPGAYQDRYEARNIDFDGAIEAIDSTDLILIDNVVAGCERTGYHLPGQACDVTGSDLWSGNEAASCLVGVGLYPKDPAVSTTCTQWSGFTLWKNADWGMYINNAASQEVRDIVSVENGVGLMSFVVGPGATGHAYAEKYVEVMDSVFIGRTSTFDCALDKLDSSDDNVKLSVQARGWRHGPGECGMTGIPFPVFTSGGNKAPEKPLANIMAVNALKGQTRIHDVTFAGFSSVGSGETESRDYMITTSKGNDDLQHPVYTSGLNIEDSVDVESYVFYHEPTLSKINPSDCVDMDCDAMKKAMVVDEDGSLLGGTGGYVLPNAGFEWDGDPRRGIGDYRIPTPMKSGLDGSLLDMNVVAPYKGIYGFQDCEWREGWNAYDCDDSVDYALLLIESMDDDTLTRRLSPVAVHAGLYVDLINGPQDHGWCVGYTCRERLSTFPAIVALDVWSHLYMSSLTPDTLRFMLLGLEDDQCVGLSIFTTDSHRLDLYVDSIEEANYVLPLNMKVTAGRYFAKPETTPDQYMPDLTQKQNGANYMKFQQNTMYWVQCGKGELYIHRAEVIIVSLGLPAMDDEEFFGENLVNNIAQFLNVDVTKVRVVNVVRETTSQSGASRRKRSSDVTYFTVEISDTPTDHSSPVDLDGCADQIITQVQLYGMDTLINTTVLYTAILEHSSTPGAEPTVLQKVGSMLLTSHPFDGRENRPFRVQPVLKVHDENDDVVNYLGAINTPWQIEASIKSGSDDQASLTGETVATFVHGIAEFSDLGVDRPGDYVIEFKVIHPAEATNYTLETNLIHVENRLLEVQGEIHTPDGLVNSPLHVSLSLVEPHLGSLVSDIEWRNHTWAVTASISDPDVYDGTLTGVTSSTIDPATGKAHFLDLRLSRNGICPVKFTVTSTPAEYVLEKVLEIAVLTSAQRNLPREKSSELQIKFPIPFDVNTAPLYAIKVRNFLSDWFGIVVTSHSYMEGSLVVTVVVQGTTDGVDSAIDDMCGFISNGTTFTFGGSAVAPSPYLTVDGRQYYGVSCGPVDKDDGLHPGIIAAIVIACVVLILLLVVVLLWKLKVYPRTKTYDTNNSKYLGGRSDTIEDILFREDTFVSLKSRGSANTPLPPVTTSAPIRLWSPRGDIPTLQRTPEPGKPRPVTPVDPETQSNERLSFSGPKPIQPPLGENGRPPWRN